MNFVLPNDKAKACKSELLYVMLKNTFNNMRGEKTSALQNPLYATIFLNLTRIWSIRREDKKSDSWQLGFLGTNAFYPNWLTCIHVDILFHNSLTNQRTQTLFMYLDIISQLLNWSTKKGFEDKSFVFVLCRCGTSGIWDLIEEWLEKLQRSVLCIYLITCFDIIIPCSS